MNDNETPFDDERNPFAFDPAPWTARAACAGMDTELFFPAKGDCAGANAAKAVCATCPVTGECLALALATHERYGIFGGLTARERRPKEIRVKRRNLYTIRVHGSEKGYQQHRWFVDDPCGECRDAHTAHVVAYKRERRMRVAS